MKRPISTSLVCFLCICLWTGCGKQSGRSSAASSTSSVATNKAISAAARSEGPPPGEKICFACKAAGMVKCMAPGCVNGLLDCPGPCLKLSRGVWEHRDVPGHSPTELWQNFPQSDGSWMAYSQGHLGHVIVMRNGRAVDSGPCKICGGTGKVPCSVCKGTGKVVCPICEGKKFIPVAWTPTDNPWLNSQPDLIRLRDGRIFFGEIIKTVGSDVTIKTRNGQWLHVDVTNVAPGPATVSTNVVI